MAKEKRRDLIDRQDLIKAVQNKQFAISNNTHPYKAIEIQGKYFREVVDSAPTVDAVEVVRCKDCKKISPSVTPIKNAVWCRGFGAYMPCDGFCSYGEK